MVKKYRNWICKRKWLAKIIYGKSGRDLWRDVFTNQIQHQVRSYAIAGGNPAVVFKYRDKEHFLKLKKQKKFH